MSDQSGTGTLGLSDTVALHIQGCVFENLPPNVVEVTKQSLLDAIGVSLAASGLAPEVRSFADLACLSTANEEASILGFGGKASAASAAFVNGAMAHAVDYEDSFDLNPCHPNASLVPAALAVAEAKGGVSGRDFLTAMAVGSDLVCRMGLSLRQTMEESGWYPPPILGAFGAVTATAKLLGLTAEQIKDAFSLTLCQATCSGEIKYSARTEIRAVREAFPAQAAVISAQLAARGLAGFETPLEGKAGFFRLYVDGQYDPETLLHSLGAKFYGEDVSFKPWPSCRGTHAFVEACLNLRQEHGFHWTDIEKVLLIGGDVHAMLVEPREQKVAPATAIDAKFSLPFTVATALSFGSITLDSFTPSALRDEATLSLADKVFFQLREEWGRDKAASAEVEIQLRSRRKLRRSVDFALGHPGNPMSQEQLIEKFVDCAARAVRPVTRGKAVDIAERLLGLENEQDMAELMAHISPQMSRKI